MKWFGLQINRKLVDQSNLHRQSNEHDCSFYWLLVHKFTSHDLLDLYTIIIYTFYLMKTLLVWTCNLERMPLNVLVLRMSGISLYSKHLEHCQSCHDFCQFDYLITCVLIV